MSLPTITVIELYKIYGSYYTVQLPKPDLSKLVRLNVESEIPPPPYKLSTAGAERVTLPTLSLSLQQRGTCASVLYCIIMPSVPIIVLLFSGKYMFIPVA